MNTVIFRAMVWDEWARVRGWWVWVAPVVCLCAAIVSPLNYVVDGSGPMAEVHRKMWEGLPPSLEAAVVLLFMVVVVLPPLSALLASTISCSQSRGSALAVELPTRYLTLPSPPGLVLLVQCVMRCLLLVPLSASAVWVVYVQEGFSAPDAAEWFFVPLIAVSGAIASAAWWRRLDMVSVGIFVLLPISIPFASPERWLDYVLPLHCLAAAILGTVSGAILLRRGGALESYSLPGRIWDAIFGASRERTPFASPGAAIRWAECPRSLWTPLGLALVVSSGFTVYTAWHSLPNITQSPWVPWTPAWLKAASVVQLLLLHLFYHAFECLTTFLPLLVLIQGFGFLRRNVFQRPFASRLPIARAQYARQAAGAMTRYVMLSTLLALGVSLTGHMIATEDNIASEYKWTPPDTGFWLGEYMEPNVEVSNLMAGLTLRPPDRLLTPWSVYSEHGYYGVIDRVEILTLRIVQFWLWLSALCLMALSPFNWFFAFIYLFVPIDLLFLAIYSLLGLVESVRSKVYRGIALWAPVLGFTLLSYLYWYLSRHYAAGFEPPDPFEIFNPRANLNEFDQLRIALTIVAFFLVPVASLRAVLWLRSRP